ncbi:MAG: DUF4011 domain-containing protein, partial [Lentisphaeraceae bacterium]|nr:DUF4011 domain-containing protein [Lentisphaeraceae bacterium]
MESDNSMSAEIFLNKGIAQGGFQTDQIISALLPLFKQIEQIHQKGKVVPLANLADLKFRDNVLFINEDEASKPQLNFHLFQLEGQPQHLPDYQAWEWLFCEHHDPLTDIYSLGLILASFTLGLNLNEDAAFEAFAHKREQLFQLNESIHPVIIRSIRQMTELDRQLRVRELSTIIQLLENYNDQDITPELCENLESENERSPQILQRLRNRLYEFSRRNRLIHFKETQQTLSLTNGSVPLASDNIENEKLLTWSSATEKAIANAATINLSNFLQFDEQPWLTTKLTNIRAAANRSIREYGFSQLHLVVVFLHWHNLKEKANERIHSPLLLLPVKLSKKKGVRDSWIIDFQSSLAVVNPTLREYLRELYGLELPVEIDLEKESIHDFHKELTDKISASEPSVNLDLVDQPLVKEIQTKVKRQRAIYQQKLQKNKNRHHHLDLPVNNETPKLEDNSAGDTQEESPLEYEERASHHNWQFDLCSLTLGNFNYRKMTLVRDYNSILTENIHGTSFEDLFSQHPKATLPNATELSDFSNRFYILPADPTQMAAVDHARNDLSYIIQGPPGTGKSQSISIVIADYAARDNRVLFVCEKRAAIDVVYHRLSQSGLQDLCCLIHDSQADKKEFIHDLKKCYQKLSSSKEDSTL